MTAANSSRPQPNYWSACFTAVPLRGAWHQGRILKQYARGRVTFTIGKDGIVRFVQSGVPNNRDLLKELAKL